MTEREECSWCGAEIRLSGFRNRRGETFCCKTHRYLSNRALKALRAKNESAERKKLSPYQRIMRAYENGRGLRLSFSEVHKLGLDHAIILRAALDDEGEEEVSTEETERYKEE